MLEQKIAELIEVVTENNRLLAAAAADRGVVISKLDAKAAKTSKVDDEDSEPAKPAAKRGRPPKSESEAPAKTTKSAKEAVDFSEMDTAAIEKALEAGTVTSAQVLEYLGGLKKLTAEDMTSATKAFLWVGSTEDGESRKELCKAILAKLGVKKFNVPELDNDDRKQVVAWFAAANAGEDVDLDAEDGDDDFA